MNRKLIVMLVMGAVFSISAQSKTTEKYDFAFSIDAVKGSSNFAPTQAFTDGKKTWLQFKSPDIAPAIFSDDNPLKYKMEFPYIVLDGVYENMAVILSGEKVASIEYTGRYANNSVGKTFSVQEASAINATASLPVAAEDADIKITVSNKARAASKKLSDPLPEFKSPAEMAPILIESSPKKMELKIAEPKAEDVRLVKTKSSRFEPLPMVEAPVKKSQEPLFLQNMEFKKFSPMAVSPSAISIQPHQSAALSDVKVSLSKSKPVYNKMPVSSSGAQVFIKNGRSTQRGNQFPDVVGKLSISHAESAPVKPALAGSAESGDSAFNEKARYAKPNDFEAFKSSGAAFVFVPYQSRMSTADIDKAKAWAASGKSITVIGGSGKPSQSERMRSALKRANEIQGMLVQSGIPASSIKIEEAVGAYASFSGANVVFNLGV